MKWRPILTSRFVVVPTVLAAGALVWNIYIGLNNGGTVEGTVRDASGAPVAGATVILYERNFVTHVEKQRTNSDQAGRFRFADNNTHLAQIEAQVADGRRSERRLLRLWFKAQDVRLDPLVVRPQG
jgi:Carboxypeptidase regulatory-like domain